MSNPKQVKEKLMRAGPELAQKYNLDLMVVFGSYATGKTRSNSDLDIGVIGQLDFNASLELSGEISSLLGLKFVEVVNLRKTSPLLAYNALCAAVVFFERVPGILADVRLSAFHRFVETKSLREIKFARTRRYIKESLAMK